MGRSHRQKSLPKLSKSVSSVGSGRKVYLTSSQSLPAERSGSQETRYEINRKSGGNRSPSSGHADSRLVEEINPTSTGSQSLPGEGLKKGKSKEIGKTGEGMPSESLGSPSAPIREIGSPSLSFRRRATKGNNGGGSSRASPRSPAAPSTPSHRIWNTVWKMTFIVCTSGFLVSLLGIIGENKMLVDGFLIKAKDGLAICYHPRGLTVPLGCLSLAFLVLNTYAGRRSLFEPYDGKEIPEFILRESNIYAYYRFNLFIALLALILLGVPTYAQLVHLSRSVRPHGDHFCLTAEIGLLGGGGLVSFCCTLLWLYSIYRVSAVRKNYFNAMKKDDKGKQVQLRIDDGQI